MALQVGVGSSTASALATTLVTSSFDTTLADGVVGGGKYETAGITVSSVTDSANNSYLFAQLAHPTGTEPSAFMYWTVGRINRATNTVVTVNLSGTGGTFRSVIGRALKGFAGLRLSSQSNTGTASPYSTAALVPSAPGYIYALVGDFNSLTTIAATGTPTHTLGLTFSDTFDIYRLSSGAASDTPGATAASGATRWVMLSAAFADLKEEAAPRRRQRKRVAAVSDWNFQGWAGSQAHPLTWFSRDLVLFAAGGPVAAAAVTEASDTSTVAATIAMAASAAVIEVSDISTATATAALVASAAVTEAGDLLSSSISGASGLNLSAAVIEASDTSAAVATVALAASVAVTEASDTVASATTMALAASAAVTEASDTSTAATTVALAASAAVTEASDTSAAVATVALAASAAVIERPDVLSATLSSQAGIDLAVTETSDTGTAAATVALAASATVTEGDDAGLSAVAAAIIATANPIEVGDLLVSTAVHPSSGGGATPEEVWSYVLSNGLTAGETLAQALAAAQNCCG